MRWRELTEAVHSFLTRLEESGLEEGASAIRTWLADVGTLCRELVMHLNDPALVERCAITHVRGELIAHEFDQRVAEAQQLVACIDDVTIRQSVAAIIAKQSQA